MFNKKQQKIFEFNMENVMLKSRTSELFSFWKISCRHMLYDDVSVSDRLRVEWWPHVTILPSDTVASLVVLVCHKYTP